MIRIAVCAIGQDSHKFDLENKKGLVLGGVDIPFEFGLLANSDGDVLLHALTNAVSGLSGKNILGEIADKLCLIQNIKDSSAYLLEALKYLDGIRIIHVSFSVECLRPKLASHIDRIKSSVALLLGLSCEDIGITATTGEGLSAAGRGEGIAVTCIITGLKKFNY